MAAALEWNGSGRRRPELLRSSNDVSKLLLIIPIGEVHGVEAPSQEPIGDPLQVGLPYFPHISPAFSLNYP
jgi:hypothetical protein